MGAKSVFVGGRNVARLARSLAVATALASVALTAVTAEAQNRRERAQRGATEYSEAFVTAYNAVQVTTQNGATDFSPARPLIPAMVAAAVSADEKDAAGNLILSVGQNVRDTGLQRQGIELMLASGKVAPEAQGQYYYYVGNFAMAARDFPAALAALRQTVALGYVSPQAAADPSLDPRTQILQVLFLSDDFTNLKTTADEYIAAATGPVPELWLNYGMQAAIESEDAAAAARYAAPLVQAYPTARNIRNAVRVTLQLGRVGNGAVMADGMRLLYAANAMSEDADVTNYIMSIDSRLMANEALRVLERGASTNLLPTTDDYYVTQNAIATERAPAERRDAPMMLRDARAAAGGLEAYEAGELFLSLGEYAQAEEMYAMAVSKGSPDRNRDLMRQGIAQAMQGKKAEATATFAQVQGDRAALAAIWNAWLASQA